MFNALGSSPGAKWRYVTRFGHFDGGLGDLRRHAAFDRLAAEFLDPAVDPADLMNGPARETGAPGRRAPEAGKVG